MFEVMKYLVWKRGKKGRIALDELAWRILGVLILAVLVFVIIYFRGALYSAAERFFKIFGG